MCGVVGEDGSLGTGYEVSKVDSNPQKVSQLLLQHCACLPAAMLPAVVVIDSRPSD